MEYHCCNGSEEHKGGKMMKQQLGEIKARRGRLHSALEENNTSIDVIIDAMYADSHTHFVWELLQNGDDAGATKLQIATKDDVVMLKHNGRPFTIEDIDAISNIGASTKKVGSTGKFGVGFKSVFSFCESVEIHNGDVAIELTGKLNFEVLENTKNVPKEKTLFIFKGVKDPKELIDRVRVQLELRQDAFMYLKNIKRIRIQDSNFVAREVLDTFHTVKMGNLTYSFKEGVRGNFYCMFPTKVTTGLPIHVNGNFEVTAARDDLRDNSEHNDMLMREYKDNFVEVLHLAKEHITVATMMEIVLTRDLKREKLIRVGDSYESWNRLVRDMSNDKIFTKFPWLARGCRCMDIEGLFEFTEEHIEKSIGPETEMSLYFELMRFIVKSPYKEEYLKYKIFLSKNRVGHVAHMCEFRHLPGHKGSGKALLPKEYIEIYELLTDLEVSNDYKIWTTYERILETQEMCEDDIKGWKEDSKEALRKALKLKPIFGGLLWDEVWVANTVLYMLNPDMPFVTRSYLTEFVGVVDKIEAMSESVLTANSLREILICGDQHRMLTMLDYLKTDITKLRFLRNEKSGTFNPQMSKAYFEKLFRSKLVFDKYGTQMAIAEVSPSTIDPEFARAYKSIPHIPNIDEYMSLDNAHTDSVWGYGDEVQETKFTAGLSPRMIGAAGELFVVKELTKLFPEEQVVHLNGEEEAYEHYDILLGDVKVEVKTRKSAFSHAKREVQLSPAQVDECIKSADFWLVIVNLDMQKMKIIKKRQLIKASLGAFGVGPDVFKEETNEKENKINGITNDDATSGIKC